MTGLYSDSILGNYTGLTLWSYDAEERGHTSKRGTPLMGFFVFHRICGMARRYPVIILEYSIRVVSNSMMRSMSGFRLCLSKDVLNQSISIPQYHATPNHVGLNDHLEVLVNYFGAAACILIILFRISVRKNSH